MILSLVSFSLSNGCSSLYFSSSMISSSSPFLVSLSSFSSPCVDVSGQCFTGRPERLTDRPECLWSEDRLKCVCGQSTYYDTKGFVKVHFAH